MPKRISIHLTLTERQADLLAGVLESGRETGDATTTVALQQLSMEIFNAVEADGEGNHAITIDPYSVALAAGECTRPIGGGGA